ncbi:hypothetical protein [Myroides sp. WP-1]|uniref:hypothetical protein n=1 Tax=Myroides sp. WP-1 TaxID=2759944 RepID=UPI0015F8A240|nr:hypothetical protein [Myroides sp. WP-1]MBB1139070.1 hypothetical protein [Myroides sp. WP-1]
MNTVINFFKTWTPIRYIRLGLALLLLFQTIDSKLWVLGIPAAYLFIQAVFNFGCKNNSCQR